MNNDELGRVIQSYAALGKTPYQIETLLGIPHYTIRFKYHADLMEGYKLYSERPKSMKNILTSDEYEAYKKNYWHFVYLKRKAKKDEELAKQEILVKKNEPAPKELTDKEKQKERYRERQREYQRRYRERHQQQIKEKRRLRYIKEKGEAYLEKRQIQTIEKRWEKQKELFENAVKHMKDSSQDPK